ncbi:MAG: hypothetical protein AAFV46_12160 [Cyanobacteria bacterium J06635_11]
MKPFLTPDISVTRILSKSGNRAAVATAFGITSIALALVASPAAAASPDYFECAAGMTDYGISETSAIAACAGARYPEDLGACVVDVNEFTGLTAESALAVCQRSRRPIEVANCTIDIHDAFLDSPNSKVLENCGRSLLPERYGTCVVEIVDATEVAVDTALDQCIRAGYRPWRIEPRL